MQNSKKTEKVIRGGCWGSTCLRTANRDCLPSAYKWLLYGFRIVMEETNAKKYK